MIKQEPATTGAGTKKYHIPREKPPAATTNTTTSAATTTSTTAYYGVFPALASTMCCWGPPLLSVVGAGSGAAAGATRILSRYRPVLLGMSASMISYSFLRVYDFNAFPNHEQEQQQQQRACCEHKHNTVERDDEELKVQRAVVWASLLVAIAGASYGRISYPKMIMTRLESSSSWPWRRATATANTTSAIKSFSSVTTATTMTAKQPYSTMELRITGMACTGCANKVQTALQNVPGVHAVVSVNPVTGKTVLQTTTRNVVGLRQAINQAGFTLVQCRQGQMMIKLQP